MCVSDRTAVTLLPNKDAMSGSGDHETNAVDNGSLSRLGLVILMPIA